MLRSILILTASLLLIFARPIRAQYALDYGVNLGLANYLGEIGGGPGLARDWVLDMKLIQTRWNPGFFIRYRVDYHLGINLSFNYARLQGADSLTSNPNRYTRNLSFRNDIFELSAIGEYYFTERPDVGRTGRYILNFKSYFFTGVGVFYNNPMAKYHGDWIALQPLGTEGQITPYGKMQMCVPMGFGFFYTFSRLHRFGWTIGYRLTFTDYIDDVSGFYPDPSVLTSPESIALSNRTGEVAGNPLAATLAKYYRAGAIRGNPNANDSYILSSFNYSYVIRGRASTFNRHKNYLYGHKRVYRTKSRF